MKFGICGPAELWPAAREAGFDVIEISASATFANDPPILPSGGIYSTNLFFPGDIEIYHDPEPVTTYTKHLFPAAEAAGVRLMVIGSGRVRNSPTPEAATEFEERFCALIAHLCEYAGPRGITLAPENLNRDETQVGIRTPEFFDRLTKHQVPFTVDTYHVFREAAHEGVAVDWIRAVPTRPAHIHIASAERQMPTPDDPQLRAFAAHVLSLGFDGCVSYEGAGERSVERLTQLHQDLRALFS